MTFGILGFPYSTVRTRRRPTDIGTTFEARAMRSDANGNLYAYAPDGTECEIIHTNGISPGNSYRFRITAIKESHYCVEPEKQIETSL